MALPSRRGTYTELSQSEPETPSESETPSPGWVKKPRPSSKFFKFQELGDSIEGKLKSFFETTYEGKTSNNAVLVTDKGEISFRLSHQLDQYFSDVEIGSLVRIEYKGKVGKMKNFDFYVAE